MNAFDGIEQYAVAHVIVNYSPAINRAAEIRSTQ